MEQKSISIEEDYIVIAPQEGGEPPQEFCAQDDSRPKLFFSWGPLVPVGRAAATLLSGFLDYVSDPKSSSMANNVTVTSSNSNTINQTAELEEQPDKATHSEGLAKRRKSMKKMHAISSFGEGGTYYSLQKFRLDSKQNSVDDFLFLKVKNNSRAPSLDSPVSPSTISQPFTYQPNGCSEHPSKNSHPDNERNDLSDHSKANGLCNCCKKASTTACNGASTDSSVYNAITNGAAFDSDSPALSQIRRASEQSNSNPGSAVLMRKPPNKSHSVPTSSELVDPSLFKCVTLNSSLEQNKLQATNGCNGTSDCTQPICPSEEAIKKIVTHNLNDFIKYSNWSALLPFLEAGDLLNQDVRHLLLNDNVSPRQKGLHFYLDTLPSQGKRAYTTFYKCLMKETEHMGHRTLQQYLCQSSSQA